MQTDRRRKTHDFAGVTGTITYAPGMRRAIKPVTVASLTKRQPEFDTQITPT